jgi:hypothetical protein
MISRRWITAFFVLFLLALTVVGCAGEAAQPAEAEAAAIYAAVIRQIYTEDDTFGGTLQPPRLYVVGATDDSAGDPETEESDPAIITDSVRQDVSGRLADLPTETVWVETRDEVALDPETGAVADEGAIITLGNIHLQGDETVHVPASIYVAGLAAGGQTYVLEEVDGAWTVTGNTGVEWIS